MTQCRACEAKSQLFLCSRCIADLRRALGELITTTDIGGHVHYGLLAYLADAAVGHAKLGNSGRCIRSEPAGLSAYTDPAPERDELGLATGRTIGRARLQRDRYDAKFADRALAAGRVNARASRLAAACRATLASWCRDVSESRGILWRPLRTVEPDFVGPLLPGWERLAYGRVATAEEMAGWLARHAEAIACGEDAADCLREITAMKPKIERVIDRPPAPRFCGQCDTRIDRKICGMMLWAPRDAIEVYCTNCKTTHNIAKLIERFKNSIDNQIVPKAKIIGNQQTANPELYDLGIMGALEEYVSWQQFNRWARDGHLKPVRYLRPGGRRGFFRHGPDDVPEYRVGDVRRVRRKMARACNEARSAG